MRWSYGARDIPPPPPQTARNMVRKQRQCSITRCPSLSVRPSVDLNDDSREGVRGSGKNGR